MNSILRRILPEDSWGPQSLSLKISTGLDFIKALVGDSSESSGSRRPYRFIGEKWKILQSARANFPVEEIKFSS